ncbi:MAG: xanthine phosphoribosyltransferase [Acutalibacteraceae bacterium]|jgi:xanthine phosphoribosyltransferase
MKALEEKILKDGSVLPGNILKVGSFLNHRLDVEFILEIGKEIADIFKNDGITKILTIETSGIAIAVCAAVAMHVPVVFAKKNKTGNLGADVYKTTVHSYTHGRDYDIVVDREYLEENDRILIVDDFLANGNALLGLIDIVKQSGAEFVGTCCAIEKGFQHGGDNLREMGIRVESLVIVDEMDENRIVFRQNKRCM